MSHVDKNRPTREWISHLRARFPCEREIDRVLTRKLERRAGPAYAPVSLATLVAGTASLLRQELGEAFTINDAAWLSGGASKLQMLFTLDWTPPGGTRTSTRLVLRMEPSESVVETSRLNEFEIIKALEGTLPVPPTYWVDAEAHHLPYPAIIYGFAEGVAKPTASSSNVTGVGTSFSPALRAILAPQFVAHYGILHKFNWAGAHLPSFDVPASGAQALDWQLNHWERVWEEDANEDVPLMRLAMAWLRANKPHTNHLSVVHGDFRTGNFLFTEHDNRISTWLDWELAHIGDRHEDLAWTMQPVFGNMAEDGRTFLIGGLLRHEEFCTAYEQASGLHINPRTLAYYRVLNSYKSNAITLATGYRAARNGKTHQDVLVAWLAGISYRVLDDLRTQLEEAL